ncbi:MAG: hypothetical protein RIB93_21665 [Coleofasciculus sp. D1-CHI-01]|uniref:hypothetical protein n=1 Tax=Coleofasciculus sp. D1-CHI-01 TaxID=3068482 RepID=UPI0032FD870C
MALAIVTLGCSATSQTRGDAAIRTDQLIYHAEIVNDSRPAVQLKTELLPLSERMSNEFTIVNDAD